MRKLKHVFEDGDNMLVAEDGDTVVCDTTYYPWVGFTPEEWKVAAAGPDLLEALERLVKQDYNVVTKRGFDDDDLNAAIAAIAKAKGQDK